MALYKKEIHLLISPHGNISSYPPEGEYEGLGMEGIKRVAVLSCDIWLFSEPSVRRVPVKTNVLTISRHGRNFTIKHSKNISENTVKFLLRDLAELTNSILVALMNLVLSYDELYWPERISTVFWSDDQFCVRILWSGKNYFPIQ